MEIKIEAPLKSDNHKDSYSYLSFSIPKSLSDKSDDIIAIIYNVLQENNECITISSNRRIITSIKDKRMMERQIHKQLTKIGINKEKASLFSFWGSVIYSSINNINYKNSDWFYKERCGWPYLEK